MDVTLELYRKNFNGHTDHFKKQELNVCCALLKAELKMRQLLELTKSHGPMITPNMQHCMADSLFEVLSAMDWGEPAHVNKPNEQENRALAFYLTKYAHVFIPYWNRRDFNEWLKKENKVKRMSIDYKDNHYDQYEYRYINKYKIYYAAEEWVVDQYEDASRCRFAYNTYAYTDRAEFMMSIYNTCFEPANSHWSRIKLPIKATMKHADPSLYPKDAPDAHALAYPKVVLELPSNTIPMHRMDTICYPHNLDLEQDKE
jgi:hypothetical protein